MKYNISWDLLRQMSKDEFFNYSNCPFCERELTIRRVLSAIFIFECKNKCYMRFSRYFPHQPSEDKIMKFVSEVQIFGIKVKLNRSFIRNENKDHFHYDYREYIMMKKRIENLIVFYKYKNRYIIKLLE